MSVLFILAAPLHTASQQHNIYARTHSSTEYTQKAAIVHKREIQCYGRYLQLRNEHNMLCTYSAHAEAGAAAAARLLSTQFYTNVW